MKLLIKIVFILLLLLTAYACTERIDIKTEAAKPGLSVFGYITNDTTQHSIKITRSAAYFSTEAPEGISNAVVSITDGVTEFMLTENDTVPGLYQTGNDVFGEEGKTYTLNILLDYDENGKMESYRAKSTMPFSTRVDSVVLIPSENIPFLAELLLYGLIPDNQKNNLALYINKNGSAESIFDYFIIISDSYFKGHDIIGYELPCMVEGGIAKGDTITFRVASFENEFSQFISHARSEAGGKNPIFSGPPANVKTNIVALEPENEIEIVGSFGAFPFKEKSTVSERNYLFPGQ